MVDTLGPVQRMGETRKQKRGHFTSTIIMKGAPQQHS